MSFDLKAVKKHLAEHEKAALISAATGKQMVEQIEELQKEVKGLRNPELLYGCIADALKEVGVEYHNEPGKQLWTHLTVARAVADLMGDNKEFCDHCGAGIGKHRRPGEGTCPKCEE